MGPQQFRYMLEQIRHANLYDGVQCMWPGGLRIRRAKDIASDQVGLLNKAPGQQGRREGDWLALLDGSGYSLIAQSRAPLTCS